MGIVKFQPPEKTIATIGGTSTNIQLLVELFDGFDWPESIFDLVYLGIKTNEDIRFAANGASITSFDFGSDGTFARVTERT